MTGKGGTAIRGLEQSPGQGRAVGGPRQGRARITATPSEKRALTRLGLRLKDGARGAKSRDQGEGEAGGDVARGAQGEASTCPLPDWVHG